MPFPESPRVQYATNPLEVVICQLRFPPVLRIETELPANFQNRVRGQYPLFGELPPIARGLDIPPSIAKLFAPALNVTRTYEFASENQLWKLTLSKEALALACHSYTSWDDFKGQFVRAFDALREEYAPSFLTRVGLRYRNVISRARLGLVDVPWSELLEPRIAAELDSPISPYVKDSDHQVLVDLAENIGKVRIFHGMGAAANGESIYVIDNDFFSEQRSEIADALPILERFNLKSGSLFRWCIKPRLHEALGPRVLERQHC